MLQFIFVTLFLLTLIAGFYSYFAPLQKPVNPMQYVMDQSGYSDEESSTRKKTQQIVMTTSNGLQQIQKNIDDIALEQNKFRDSLQDQQELLKSTGRMASDVMLMAQKEGQDGDKDILKLKNLASQMQDQQRILVDHGQELITLNDQLTQNRQAIADQIQMSNFNTQSSIDSMNQRYAELKDQAQEYFHSVLQHNQDVIDKISQMHQQMHDAISNLSYNNSIEQENIKERINNMMDKEHENMLRLADNEEKNKNLLQEAQQKEEDAKQQLDDKLQQNQDTADEERQKSEDQQEMMKERIEDQMQRMQDQQSQRNQ